MADPSAQMDPGDGAGLAAVAEHFEAHRVVVDGATYGYRLLAPRADLRDVERPLVVFLHGAGERGDDNLRQLTWLPQRLAQPELRERHPCYLLALQCPGDERWVDVEWGRSEPQPMPAAPTRAMRAVVRALDDVLQRGGVDRARVYLTGLSMGGYGTWDLSMRSAETFAAALAICGGGDPDRVAALVGMPVQVWHGADDPVVPVAQSRAMVAAFREREMPVGYFELDGVGHDAWRAAYGDDGGLDWLFAQDQRQQGRGPWRELPVVPQLHAERVGDGAFEIPRGSRFHAPAELRRMASYVLDELDLPAVRRPGLIDGVEAAPGDIVLQIDAELATRFVLDVADALVVRVRDVASAPDALAAMFQALRAGPVRHGTYQAPVDDGPAMVDVLTVEVETPDWTRETLRGLLRECWLGSVEELHFVREPGRHDPDAWREFTVLADRVAVRVVAARPQADRRLVVAADDRVAQVLQRAPGDGGFAATVRADVPAGVVRAARRMLPAALERSRRRDGPVHAAGFRARLLGRWR